MESTSEHDLQNGPRLLRGARQIASILLKISYVFVVFFQGASIHFDRGTLKLIKWIPQAVFPDIAMISPEVRQSFLLSSITVFMSSIQIASIGPSKTSHFRSVVWLRDRSRKSTATMPSVHSSGR